jgi:hypothetical protein
MKMNQKSSWINEQRFFIRWAWRVCSLLQPWRFQRLETKLAHQKNKPPVIQTWRLFETNMLKRLPQHAPADLNHTRATRIPLR